MLRPLYVEFFYSEIILLSLGRKAYVIILEPLKTESPFTKVFFNFHAFVVPSNLQYLEPNLSSTVCWPIVSSLWKLLVNAWEEVGRKIPLIRRVFEQLTVEPLSGNGSLRNGMAR